MGKADKFIARAILKSGREKTVLRRHPWIFSGAVQSIENSPDSGSPVEIISANNEWLARGAWSPSSQIRFRIWTIKRDEKINADFFLKRISAAIEYRHACLPDTDTAYRLVNAESDGLPGLIVDRYADYLVCQFLSAGSEFHRQAIIEALNSLVPVHGIYERSDVEVRNKEGLQFASGCIAGDEPPGYIQVQQGNLKLLADVRKGHKTGMYLDQRDNRKIVMNFSKDMDVLNCFAHSGNFALAALLGGARHVTNIESSATALEILREQAALNNIPESMMTNVQGDVFHMLRKFREDGRQFDMVILDPPKFVSSARDLKRGCRGYKDINLQAIKLLRKGGILVTFSCSGHVSTDLFQKIVADAALDAGCDMKIIRNLGQAIDHPVSLHFPEGRYLKGLLCYL